MKGRKLLLSLGALVVFLGAAGGAIALVKYKTWFGNLVLGGGSVSEADLSSEDRQKATEIREERELLKKKIAEKEAEKATVEAELAADEKRSSDLEKRRTTKKGKSDEAARDIVGQLNRRLTEETVKLNDTQQLKRFVTNLLGSIPQVRASLASLASSFKQVDELERELAREAFLLLQREQQVELASLYNSSFWKEFALYIFGFKWFWGIFTGYANTTSNSVALQQFEKAKVDFAKKEVELKQAITDARDGLNLNFQQSLGGLTTLGEDLGRFSDELSTKLVADFLNPFRGLLDEFNLKGEQLKLARESYHLAFTSGLDSNLYLTWQEAKSFNEDPESLPQPLVAARSSFEQAQSEFEAVKTKLADLSTKLDEFLVKITTEELDMRKIDYAIATSEGLIREINQRIASLKR